MHHPDSDDKKKPGPPSEFGFARDESWLEQLREATRPEAPRKIGPYEILGETHRGGQGVVYRARDTRTGAAVALKRLIAGQYSTQEAIARFQREVEIASELEHPGIVLTHGMEIADGQPVLVMEWIEGVPITTWSSNARHGTPEALRLATAVCDAVHYAHRHGVLHRDLKPSNILVDAQGQPKVVDFGVAKVLNRPAAPKLTASAEFVGTLAYAAPEQVRGGTRALDARADVYAIGAMLYEMLTGRLPYDASSGIADALRALERERVSPPSALASGIGYELDTIVLKALAVDPAMRYQSVDALGEDLRRLQRGDPILAHPPSTWYQIRKLVARNRVASLFATASFALTITLAIVLAVQSSRVVRAHEREQIALRQTDDVTDFIETLFRELSPLRSGERATVVGLAERATEKIDSYFEPESLARAKLRQTLGTLLCELGHYSLSAEVLSEALALREQIGGSSAQDLAATYLDLANARFEESESTLARAAIREAIRIYREIDGSDLAGALAQLCRIEQHLGNHDEAHAAIDEAQTIIETRTGEPDNTHAMVLSRRAQLLLREGELEESLELVSEAVAIKRSIYGESHPQVLDDLRVYALITQIMGRFKQANALTSECLKIAESIGDTDSLLIDQLLLRMGDTHLSLGESEQATHFYGRARSTIEARGGERDTWLAAALLGLGSAAQLAGRHDDAIRHMREAIAFDRKDGSKGLFAKLGALAQTLVARSMEQDNADARLSDQKEAEQLFVECLKLEEALFGPNPASARLTLSELARLATLRGDHKAAVDYDSQLLLELEVRPRAPPIQVVNMRTSLAKRLQDRANGDGDSVRCDEALQQAKFAADLLSEMQLPAADATRVGALSDLGQVLFAAGKFAECASIQRELLEMETECSSHSPEVIVGAHFYLARVLDAEKDFAGALANMRQVPEKSKALDVRNDLATASHTYLAEWCERAGLLDQAAQWRELIESPR